MKTLLEMLLMNREQCTRLVGELSTRFAYSPAEPPLSAFGMCFNTTTLIAETNSYFYEVWENLEAQGIAATQQQRDEAKQRVLLLMKMLFVFGLSAIEHSAKAATDKYPLAVPLDRTKKWQYWSNILGKSHALGIISVGDKAKWDAVIKLRNTLVHNNGVASEDLVTSYPSGAIIELKTGKMTEGDLQLFARLMEWSMESYAAWSAEFLKRAGFPVV